MLAPERGGREHCGAGLVYVAPMKLKSNWRGGKLESDAEACCDTAEQSRKRW